MVRRFARALFVISACSTAQASTAEKYPVSLLVQEIGFQRFGNVVFRYVEFNALSEYPCLRLETMTDRYKLIDRIEVCKFRMGDKTIDVRKRDPASAFFGHYQAKEKEFHFTAMLDFSRPGHGGALRYSLCKVMVSSKGKLSGPVCEEIDEQTYDEMDKQDEKN